MLNFLQRSSRPLMLLSMLSENQLRSTNVPLRTTLKTVGLYANPSGLMVIVPLTPG